MKKLYYTLLALSFFAVVSCGGSNDKKSESESSETTTEEQAEEQVERPDAEPKAEIIGFATLEELSKNTLHAIKSGDFNEYNKYVASQTMMETEATAIEDDAVRKEFIEEFKYAHEAEKQFFKSMVKAIHVVHLDPDSADINHEASVDYKGGVYAPVSLKEVIIPIPMKDENGEVAEGDIIYVAVEIDGKYYLTSELML